MKSEINFLQTAKYWKNGLAKSLIDVNSMSSANAIAVDGSNVHVAGWEYYVSDTWSAPVAKYWKNNIPTYLTDSTGLNQQGEAYDIVLSYQ